MRRTDRRLPSARVRFEPGFVSRLAGLEMRLVASRQRSEGMGLGSMDGAGTDLVGFRPYRPGEDLRQLDWNLLARLEKPFVRVTRREAGESWAVALDASASMGVGPPGKLQRAAECTAAFWALGCRLGARMRVVVSAGEGAQPRLFEGRSREGSGPLLRFLEELVAEGCSGLGSVLDNPQWFRECSRVLCIGDLGGVTPEGVLSLRRGSREVSFLQLCSPQEFHPAEGPVEWWDPEQDEVLELDLSRADCLRYHDLLEQQMELWRSLASRHRIAHACRSTAEDFETLMSELFSR
jgi:uncharacterized protein (DUF58 family)